MFKCLLCSSLHNSQQEAEDCCQHVVEIHCCAECDKEHYSEFDAERCCT